MRKKIIVGDWVQKQYLPALREQFDVFEAGQLDLTNESFIAHLQEAEGLLGFSGNIDETLVKKAPKLKIVSNNSLGVNNLDIAALTKHGIMATNTPGVLTNTVADLVFGLLLATARQIPRADQYVKDGAWEYPLPVSLSGVDVYGKTIGIIGMGQIGKAIAKRAHLGFDMPVVYDDMQQKDDVEKAYKARKMDLPALLQTADYVVLMTPLTPETKGLIDLKAFKMMKSSAIFINCSRGETVVEADLITALQEKEIAAAGLDVFEQEPIGKEHPLLQMSNVVTLPHIGSSTLETEAKMTNIAIENLTIGLNGEKPPHLVNESVWNTRKINHV